MNTVSRKFLLAMLVTGCGKVEPVSDAASAGDGAVAHCNPTTPFGMPKVVTALNSPMTMNDSNDEDAYLLADGVTVWFSSNRSGAFHAYQAMGTSNDAASFTSATQLSDSTQPVERPVELDSGLTMLGVTQSVTQSGVTFSTIGIAHRMSPMASFGPLDTMGAVKNVNDYTGNIDTLDVYSPPDGNVMYFSSDRDGGGIHHLFRSARNDQGDFGMPEPVAISGVDNTMDLVFPVVSADERTLYYAIVVNQVAQVYRATRPSTTGTFSNAAALHLDAPDRTVKSTSPSSVSSDDCVLYLTTDDGQGGQRKIYVATRSS